MRGKREVFSKEFKLEAVRMMVERKKPSAELARKLGLRRNHFYKWKESLETAGESAFPGSDRRALKGTKAKEISRFRRKQARVEEENAILQKPWRSLLGS